MTSIVSSAEQKKLMAFASGLALGAGTILRSGFHKRLAVTYKGRINPVTDLDLKSERHIVNAIRRRYPDHDILAEEGSRGGDRSEFRWIIDPLDGTVNYAHGFPVYCVSIGLEYRGKVLLGVVYDPERNELFHAIAKRGAFMDRDRIYVSSERRLERALLATGFAYDIATARKNNLGLFARMAKRAQGVRRPGSAAIDICWLASGRVDGFWELKLHPWDTAAAVLVLIEAGGRATRINGSEYSIFDPDMLASNGHLHRVMSHVLNGR
ncbi:MAG: inositol monophosphatase family protein [Candidatus Zixiibacteriota bacterium]